MILPPNFDKVHKRYHYSVTGNSSENARGLDSFEFADYEVCMSYHIGLTYILNRKNPLKFQVGTPNEVWRIMERCWDVEPTPERIVEDELFESEDDLFDMVLGNICINILVI